MWIDAIKNHMPIVMWINNNIMNHMSALNVNQPD
jgi:hypothetical protein